MPLQFCLKIVSCVVRPQLSRREISREDREQIMMGLFIRRCTWPEIDIQLAAIHAADEVFGLNASRAFAK